MQVGRIGDRQEQALAALHQRQGTVLLQQLFADRTYRIGVRSDGVQIEQRYAELVGGGNGDVAGRGEVCSHQMGDQVDALLLGLGNSVLHGLLVQQAILHQALREAAEGRRAVPLPMPQLRYHSWT